MAPTSEVDLIRNVPLFSALNEEQAGRIAALAVRKKFRRGQKIVEQGQKSGVLYILLSGRVRVTAAVKSGREVILASLVPGDFIGEMSLIDRAPHSATCRAEVPTEMLMLAGDEFLAHLPGNWDGAHEMMKTLVKRLRSANRSIESLALMDVHGRVARALLSLAEPAPDGGIQIRQKVTRQDIAKMIGASREMVSRVMLDLQARGFITSRADGSLALQDRLHTFC